MSDQLAAAAAALGVPAPIVQRSAEARAKEVGANVEDILAAWAGGAPAPTTPAAPTPPATEARGEIETTAPQQVARAVTEAEAPEPEARGETLAVGPKPAVRTVAAPPAPKEVTPKEAVRYPVVVSVPTAGLKERTLATVPRWLAAVFMIIPLFGLLQLAGATTNECGAGTELLPDRITGELRNCDGTEFVGRGTGGGGTDHVALGSQIFAGQLVPVANCEGCHGAEGQGGVGPALANVATTFSSCTDHIEWVTKATLGFQAEGRTGYGDANKAFGSVAMPGFGSSLTPEQLAAVVAFERVRFGGQPSDQVLADCGLVEPAAEGEGAASTTTTP